jgi:hypothetical protein
MKKLIALALLSGTASAQVYDLNLSMPGTFGGTVFFVGEVSPTADISSNFTDAMTTPQIGNPLLGGGFSTGEGSYTETFDYTANNGIITGAYASISDSQWTVACGSYGGGACSGTVVDPPKATAAPEIDGGTALAALTLLGGGILVWRARQ